MGGLKEPNVLVVQLLVYCELQYQHFRGHIMHNGAVDPPYLNQDELE